MSRAALLVHLAQRLGDHPIRGVLRVAIDGVDGAGKTTFADELAVVLRGLGRQVIRASADGFHQPRALRYQLGRRSPEGFYRDSYNYAAMQGELLHPLGPGGSLLYRTAVFDVVTDQPVDQAQQQAQAGDILLVDGLFLHRPELREYWDDSVFLRVDFTVSVARLAVRDAGHLSTDPEAPSNRRYVEGNRLYFREVQPERQAGVVVDHNDLAAPFIVKG